MNEILSIHDLSVNYGGIEAVKGISFDVHEGEIVTLIGANGAGKSSTLRTITGLVKPSGGTINFRGDDITGRDATTIVKKGITLVPEGRHIFQDLTVLENLKVGAYLRSDDISGDIQWDIKETNSTYTAIQLKYQVKCKGDDNDQETYNVREFFRVRYLKG